ncbi:alpha/beta hydrolase [Aurantimonas coralicida]|uniref:alpha/beta hydrolase n=1 Tax=Aurantimonas coralicida TaxID=182270 RepID=UPI002396DCC1|nr:alpha/beta hydrolase [Aurantimonas coralicida]MDE0924831.1 alpha/beta hydrolase [Aurantimonas coralicida]
MSQMVDAAITDFDTAYGNAGAIAGAETYPLRWRERAAAFRQELEAAGRARLACPYGDGERAVYDLFLPEGTPAGLAVYVHGGYWKAFGRSEWSHLAAGALARGFAVAMPSYPLCPTVRIAEITRHVARFLDTVAAEVSGPIRLSGHSAGGHLVTRMICTDSPLSGATAARIDRVLSISGVHDLRPLLKTQMNEILALDLAEARAESPALLEPYGNAALTCLVGGDELPEFRRQNTLLASAWRGLGLRTAAIEAPGRHHFDVIDALEDPASDAVALLAG